MMQHALSAADLALLNGGLTGIGVRVSLQAGTGRPLACRIIRNPDGSLRWLWPAAARQPQFLRFYHAGSLKAKVFAGLAKACFALGAGRLVSNGTVTLYIADQQDSLLHSATDWALFTGTAGENRKLVLWHRDATGTGAFTKLPLTTAAALNIAAERTALQGAVPAGVILPTLRGAASVLTQEDIYEDRAPEAVTRIGELPVAAFQAWLSHDIATVPAGQLSWLRDLRLQCLQWHISRDVRLSPPFCKKLEALVALFPEGTAVSTATAHGDFTPWNVRRDGDRLLMIDWELSRAGMPVLYDLFHFIYQQQILVRRRPFRAIRAEIDTVLAQPHWQDFLRQHRIDARKAEQLYLLYTAGYYAAVYGRQPEWHTQVGWLLRTWEEAMSYWLQQEGREESRAAVLADMTHFLYDQPYAAMKQRVEDWAALPATSDLDLCLPAATEKALTAYLLQHHAVARVRSFRQTFMSHLTVFLHDGSLIHIDCIREFRRKNILFLDAAAVWSAAVPNKAGVKVPQPADDLAYIWLFYRLNGAEVPTHYPQPRPVEQAAYHYAGGKGTAPAAAGPEVRALHLLHNLPATNSLQRLGRTLQYGIDVLHGLLPRRGCVVTFSGVDGAGKSTVIDTTRKRIEKELRMPVVVLRHRPSLLPILSAWTHGKKAAEQKAATTLPRQGKNGSVLSSVFRFGYYYTDYLLGQFYIQCRYVWRGYVVLYDRYYFDFINDSKRSNIVLPASFTSWCYRFLLKPQCNFFLYAPAPVILARKQELDEHSIVQLTSSYLNLFERLGRRAQHRYVPVCNLELDQTLDQVFQTIKKQRA